MKRTILGLLSFALLGATPLLAQHATMGQPVPVPAPVVVASPGACPTSACEVECHEGKHRHGHHGVCVPEHYVKENKTWVFSCGSEPFCLCYRHGLGLFKHGSDCGSCEDGRCEHSYTRKYLVKKLRVCTEDAVKCVPQAPCCDAGHCASTVVTAPPVTGTVVPPPAVAIPYPGQRLPATAPVVPPR